MERKGILLAILACASTAAADSRVVIESATDDTRAPSAERKRNSTTLRHTLDQLITTHSLKANAHIDASVVSLTVERSDNLVIVSAQVRIAISDDTGRIHSVLSGGAKVEAPARMYRARGRIGLRNDALSAAVTGMFDKVKTVIAPMPKTKVRVAMARSFTSS